jgi:hypothetical protein
MMMMLLFFVLGGGGLFSCIACVGVIGWFSLGSSDVKPAGPIAANDKKDAQIDLAVRDLVKKVDVPIDASKPRDKKTDVDKLDDRPPLDDKRDLAKKDFLDRPAFDLAKKDLKDGPIFDKKFIDPPPIPGGGITVVFGADGVYRNDNNLNEGDGLNRERKKHKAYFVHMEAGCTYNIHLISNTFDAYLYLIDDANLVLAQDDDSGGGLNSLIIHNAKRTGLYRIDATSLGGGSNGQYSLTIRRTGVPIAGAPGELKIGTSVVKSGNKVGSYAVTELHLNGLSDAVTPTAPTCWDTNGQNFYWLQNGRELVRVGVPDLKVNARVMLPAAGTQIGLSSEGVVALLNNGEAFVLDPQNLQVRNKFPQVPGRLAAAPTSHHVVISTNSYGRLDVKSGQRTTFDTANVPAAANMNIRTMVLSPDGKYLCVQGSDYSFHRMRVSDNKLIHEGSLAAISKSQGTISISPDSQRVGFSSITLAAGKKTTDIYAIDNWNAPLVSMPMRLRRLSLDSAGGVWGEFSPGYLRYYDNPNAALGKDLKIGRMPFTPTQLLAQPRGDGCLVVYQEGTNQRAAWVTVAR